MKAAKVVDYDKIVSCKEKRELDKKDTYEEIISQLKEDEILVALYYFKDSTNIAMALNPDSKEVFDLMIQIDKKNPGKFIAQLLHLYAIPEKDIDF